MLCYHQVRDWQAADSRNARVYIVPVATFREQVELLRLNGYNAILPDQLIAHIQSGAPLPPHPVLLTFDDGAASQYANALPGLDKAGYKATFFIMTVSLGRPKFMTRENVVTLSRKGHVIGCHTWDHHNVTTYKGDDWVKQVVKPKQELEKITGKPVKYFAYPNGIWDIAAADQIRKYGYTAAFRLWGREDNRMPLFTLRRVLVSGYWTPQQLMKEIHKAENSGKNGAAASARNAGPAHQPRKGRI